MKDLIVLAIISLFLSGCGDSPTTPLGKAAAHGTEADIEALLKDASAGEIQGALISAARAGNKAGIPLLIAAGADPNQPAGVNSWPPLMHAIHKNRIGTAEALIDLGAKVNHTQSNGDTPLMMAAGYGYTDIVRMLLEKGADPAMRTDAGITALDLAITGVGDIDRFTIGKCQTDTVKVLLEAGSAHTPRP